MLYIIENSRGNEAGTWDSLTNQMWPDGATFSGTMSVGDTRVSEDGLELYTVFEVLQKRTGVGPRKISVDPIIKVDDEWVQITTMGPALPPPPDPKPGDKNYDYSELRRRDYPDLGDQFDMQFHDLIDGTETWKDAIQAVKDKWPKEID
jgi:hypothetical protein